MEQEFQEYPKWKYRGSEAVEVADAEAEKALGKGWRDAPPGPDQAE